MPAAQVDAFELVVESPPPLAAKARARTPQQAGADMTGSEQTREQGGEALPPARQQLSTPPHSTRRTAEWITTSPLERSHQQRLGHSEDDASPSLEAAAFIGTVQVPGSPDRGGTSLSAEGDVHTGAPVNIFTAAGGAYGSHHV